jgi:5'-deoxynucleotidase YfbR-like HD superfamily hydrolase
VKNGETIMTAIEFIDRTMDMKILKRQGWQRYTNQPESLAEHSFGCAVLALLLADREQQLAGKEVDFSKERVILLALVHDFPETMFLDIDRSLHELLGEDRANEIKSEIDTKSIESLANMLPGGYEFTKSLINQLVKINGDSIEARLVRAADLLDLFFRAKWLFSRNQIQIGSILRSFTIDVLEKLKKLELKSVNELILSLAEEKWFQEIVTISDLEES